MARPAPPLYFFPAKMNPAAAVYTMLPTDIVGVLLEKLPDSRAAALTCTEWYGIYRATDDHKYYSSGRNPRLMLPKMYHDGWRGSYGDIVAYGSVALYSAALPDMRRLSQNHRCILASTAVEYDNYDVVRTMYRDKFVDHATIMWYIHRSGPEKSSELLCVAEVIHLMAPHGPPNSLYWLVKCGHVNPAAIHTANCRGRLVTERLVSYDQVNVAEKYIYHKLYSDQPLPPAREIAGTWPAEGVTWYASTVDRVSADAIVVAASRGDPAVFAALAAKAGPIPPEITEILRQKLRVTEKTATVALELLGADAEPAVAAILFSCVQTVRAVLALSPDIFWGRTICVRVCDRALELALIDAGAKVLTVNDAGTVVNRESLLIVFVDELEYINSRKTRHQMGNIRESVRVMWDDTRKGPQHLLERRLIAVGFDPEQAFALARVRTVSDFCAEKNESAAILAQQHERPYIPNCLR